MGLKFSSNDYSALEFKTYFSHKLNKKLLSQDLINQRGIDSNGNPLLSEIEEHIINMLSEKSITFLI